MKLMPAPAEDFARRLRWALDQARFEPGRGRTTSLAQRYAVSRETARKWLNGLALPELERMIELAVDFNVSFDWLATGRMAVDDAPPLLEETPGIYNVPTLSGDEMQVIRRLRRMPQRKVRAVLELIELLD